MERQAGLGRSLEDVLDSVPPVEPLEPAPTHVLFGLASEEAPLANGAAPADALHTDPLVPSDSTKNKKKKKKKSDGDEKKKSKGKKANGKKAKGKGDKKKKKKK